MQREKPPEWREKQKGSRGIRRGQRYRLVFQFPIRELDDITLCLEWTKLREENNRLYEINNQANRGWRGFILRLIGVNLPDKRTEFTQRLLLTRKISGSVMKK